MRRRDLILSAAAMPLLTRAAAAQEAPQDGPLRMRDLYERDMSFSELALSLEGRRIEARGFMAPPLDPDVDWFVLTKRPMSVCPFCETAAEWPRDILAVHTKRTLVPVAFNRPIEVSGVLELGQQEDARTGFVSRVRLQDAVYGAA